MQTAHETAAESVEKSLIGAILVDRDVFPIIADRITTEAFANARHRVIFNAASRCWSKGRPSDIAAVHAELANDPNIGSDQEWLSYASDLSEAISHVYDNGFACHGQYYADAVVAFARRRAISDAGANLVKLAYNGDDMDSALVLHEVMSGMDKFGATTEQRGPMTYDEIIPGFQEQIMRMMNGDIPTRVTPTGWKYLDRKLAGGFYQGEFIILAARPAMGKTALALQMAHQVAKQGQHVIVFSAEMSKESLLRRAAAELMGRAIEKPEHEFTGQEFDAFLKSLEQLRSRSVSVDDTPGITTAQMQVRVQNAQRKHDVGLVIFDYIELAGDSAGKEGEERRINAISKSLQKMARTCNVPVVGLCQLNRQVESRDNKRPRLADLRYSGSLEQDADKVLFLYRHDYYVDLGSSKPEPGTEGTAEVIVAKHRNGATGDIKLRFTPETMRFDTIDFTLDFRPSPAA